MKLYILLCYLATGVYSQYYKNKPVATIYTDDPDNPGTQIEIKTGNFEKLNPDWETKFLIHDYKENRSVPYFRTIPAEYRKKEKNYNFLLIDWSVLSMEPYATAQKYEAKIGQHLAEYFNSFVIFIGYDMSRIHLIGVGTGAHILGYAVKSAKFNGTTGNKIRRLTALDPLKQRTRFKILSRKQGFSKQSAQMVDVLHTSKIHGLLNSAGTVDFYANWGKLIQTGCEAKSLKDILKMEAFDCSHKRAVEYFIESINSKSIIGSRCKNNKCKNPKYTVYGDSLPMTAKGNYYFSTNAKPPYGREFGNKVAISESVEAAKTTIVKTNKPTNTSTTIESSNEGDGKKTHPSNTDAKVVSTPTKSSTTFKSTNGGSESVEVAETTTIKTANKPTTTSTTIESPNQEDGKENHPSNADAKVVSTLTKSSTTFKSTNGGGGDGSQIWRSYSCGTSSEDSESAPPKDPNKDDKDTFEIYRSSDCSSSSSEED